jgi:hypothetical protein
MFTALTLLFAASASAQQSSIPPLARITLGPFVGLNYTTLSGDDATDAKSRVDFALGGQLDFSLASSGFFRTGLVYSRRGAKTTESGTELKLKVSYLEVPVLFGYRFPTGGGVRPYLMGGGQLGIKVGCKFEGTDQGVTASIDCDNPDLGADFKSTDISLVGGGGVLMPVGTSSLAFDLRYALGLSSIEKNSDLKNRGFTLGVGFMIPVGR